jgi:hypothetical protein
MAKCPRCGGSGRETVVNSGGLPEFGGTCLVCGGLGKIGPDDISYTTSGSSSGGGSGSSPGRKASIEESIIGITVTSVWVAISYFGIQIVQVDWYWAVGFGFLVAWFTDKLLKGPLFWLIKFIAKALVFSMVIGLLSLVLWFVANSGD